MRHMLLKNLNRDRYNIRLCCLTEKGNLGKVIEEMGYSVDELHLDPNPKNLLTTYRLARYLKRQKIDILHTCLFKSNFHGRLAAALCGIPHVVIEEHSEHYLYKKFRHFFYIFSDFLLSKRTDAIICCSDSVKDDIRIKEGLPYSKLKTIKNCVDPEMYAITEARGSVRKRLGIGEEMAFIMTASFSPKKRHMHLLAALKELKKAGWKFKCLFAGFGGLKEKVREAAERYGISGNIILLGKVDDIQNYLNASDVFILPSLKEGLSIALMEAMYMGIPGIATDIAANRELIDNRVNGFLVPPASVDSLSKALAWCLGNRETVRDMGRKAKEKVESGYLADGYAKKFLEIWDNLGVGCDT